MIKVLTFVGPSWPYMVCSHKIEQTQQSMKKKTTYTTEQCSACHSSFWYLEVFLTVDPCVYMKYFYKIKRATNTKQTKHTHTTEQSVLCIIIYWHSTWRHLHRISIYNFKCCFFYFTKITVTNKQTIAKTIMTFFFFTSLNSCIWVQSCDSYCYSMLSVFILFLIISLYSYFLYNMFSSEYAYAYACFVRVQSLKHIK